jgi:hypothetical protein
MAIGAGYHTANVAEHYVHVQLPADGGFVTVMENLATTTSTERETVSTLTKTIATLTDQLAANDIRAKAKDAEIKCLLGGSVQLWLPLLTGLLIPMPGSLTRPIITIMLVTWLPGWDDLYKCHLNH